MAIKGASADSPRPSEPHVFGPVSAEYVAAVEQSVCDEDFDNPQQRAMAANLARRQADRELIDALARDHFDGPGQKMFETELAAYGYPVMMAWTRTGEIFKKVADRGRPLDFGDTGPGWCRDDRCELSSETVARALEYFRNKVLLAGMWDHTRGATIRTYFVGACLFQFPNVFQRLRAERRRWDSLITDALDDPDTFAKIGSLHGSDDPAHIAMTRHEIEQVMAELADKDPVLHRIAILRLLGYTDAHAAALSGLTPRAVEGHWYRYRRERRRRGEGTPA
jgi:hypothetical protein